MNRVYHTFHVKDTELMKQQMLSWANQFSICCFMDDHQYNSAHQTYECIAGVGVLDAFEPGQDFFNSLSAFLQSNDDWLFGHFNYELKNKIEPQLLSQHPDSCGFPDCFLFVPEVLLALNDGVLTIGVCNDNVEEIYKQLVQIVPESMALSKASIKPRQTKEDYLDAVNKLKEHIHYGDCYVINYCQEFLAETSIHPYSVYRKLSSLSPNPFAAYYKLIDKYLMCASPERFVKKDGPKIISQPIKGTIARDKIVAENDELHKQQLINNKKERSENVMVVDLVRNDLSKICEDGSVVVDELFGLYSFPNVHHMISTVSGRLSPNKSFVDVLKAMFPMGSMTGAPKIKVMELTEQYEQSKRGIYSGTVGYITPDKNFDFNVVIRSIVYNETSQQLSFHVGSAITAYCNAEKEYEECLLKGEAMMKIFS